jgi:hypothetical protein
MNSPKDRFIPPQASKIKRAARNELYSSGSTLTIDAPWLLPIQSAPGFFESST